MKDGRAWEDAARAVPARPWAESAGAGVRQGRDAEAQQDGRQVVLRDSDATEAVARQDPTARWGPCSAGWAVAAAAAAEPASTEPVEARRAESRHLEAPSQRAKWADEWELAGYAVLHRQAAEHEVRLGSVQGGWTAQDARASTAPGEEARESETAVPDEPATSRAAAVGAVCSDQTFGPAEVAPELVAAQRAQQASREFREPAVLPVPLPLEAARRELAVRDDAAWDAQAAVPECKAHVQRVARLHDSRRAEDGWARGVRAAAGAARQRARQVPQRQLAEAPPQPGLPFAVLAESTLPRTHRNRARSRVRPRHRRRRYGRRAAARRSRNVSGRGSPRPHLSSWSASFFPGRQTRQGDQGSYWA